MNENGPSCPLPEKKKESTSPSVALILGSEGIKSFCALPFIEHLQEEGVNIDLVAGVSGGALLAAFFGAGYNLKQIQDIFSKTVDPRFFKDVDYRSVLDIANTGLGRFNSEAGILKTDSLKKTLTTLFKEMDISDLSPKTLISTTDLNTGHPVILDKGNLAESIYASGALYPLMPPGSIDGQKLIDGAFSSPIPLMECVKRNYDIIIAIYFDDACNPEPEGFLESYFNSTRIFKRSILTSQLSLSIDMHHFEIVPVYIKHPRPIEMWEVKKLTEIVHAGKVALSNQMSNIKSVISIYRKKEKEHREKQAAETRNKETEKKETTDKSSKVNSTEKKTDEKKHGAPTEEHLKKRIGKGV